jgi:F-box protein 21
MLHCFPAGMLSELFRYYATAVLDHVHRSKALEEWAKLGKGEEISLERALGSFDLFVLHDQHGDLLEV